jgi:hypothetical protein
MSHWNQQSWDAAIDRVMDRAADDPDFRSLALKDPHAAVEQVTGQPLPREVNLRFSDNEAMMVYRLPDSRAATPVSDEELESMAGGLCISSTSFCVSSKCSNVCFAHTKFCF